MTAAIRQLTIYWLPLILYCSLIYFLSGRPAADSLQLFTHADKVAHFGVYTILGILWARAYGVTPLGRTPVHLAMAAILSVALYALSDEWHQSFVPARTAELADWIADAAGGTCGVFIYLGRSGTGQTD